MGLKTIWNDTHLQCKGMNALICAFSSKEFNRESNCKTTKEIWDTLELMHGGTNQVKESKINILTPQYKLFKIGSEELLKTRILVSVTSSMVWNFFENLIQILF